MDQATAQAATKMTGQGEAMMFHIDPGTLLKGDQDILLWQNRSACYWNMVRIISAYRPAGTD